MSAKPFRVVPDSPYEDAHVSGSSLSDAATGGRKSMLLALRDRLASTIDDPELLARDLASLSIRYMAVIQEIEDIENRVVLASEGGEIGNAAESPDEAFDPQAI